MQLLKRFLADLDARCTALSPEPQVLPLIGAGALMLRTRYERGTKNGDVLQTRAVDDRAKAQLLELAGPRSKLFVRHRISQPASYPSPQPSQASSTAGAKSRDRSP